MSKKQKFILIDSNSLIHRAYHAYPTHLSTSKGEKINVVYGFTFLLLKVIEELTPEYIICAFDSLGPTKRHEKYEEYKANRKPMEQDLVDQLPKVKKVAKAFGIPVVKKKGFEADDLIGTIESDDKVSNLEKIIVSGDQDMFQLVDDDTQIYLSGKSFSQSKLYGPKEVRDRTGLDPSQIVELKALYGDPSDNIPGVKGIGKKGAEKLIKKYKDVDNLYKNLEKVETRYKNKLEEQKDEAYLSRELATIIKDAPIDFTLKDCKWDDRDPQAIRDLFQKYEFRSLLKKASSIIGEELPVQDTKSKKNKKVEQEFLEDVDEVASLLEQLQKESVISFYLKNFSDNCLEMTPQTISIADGEGNVYSFGGNLLSSNGKLTSAGTNLSKMIQAKGTTKVFYNLKSAVHCFRNLGIELKDTKSCFDIQLAAFLTQGGMGSVSLKDLAFNYLGEVLVEEKNYDMGLRESKEAHFIGEIHKVLVPKLKAEKRSSKWTLGRLFLEIEMPLTLILAQMESCGIKVDSEYLRHLSDDLEKKLEELEQKIFSSIGHEFNINSPKQVAEVLFEELQLPCSKKTKGGSFSTSSSVLEKLRGTHEVVDLLLKFRELAKIKSTYTTTLLEAVDPKTGRIHTTYNQAIASTGRLTSTDPNMQNIPISSELGKKVRHAFVSDDGWKMISFDYSQQELRILAHLSEDESLINAFNEGIDIHKLTASKIFSKTVDKISKKERGIGKTINFGVMYGMSSRGLAASLEIEIDEAQEFIDRYFEEYSDVQKFYDKYIEQVEKKGYATTMFGRRRQAEGLKSGNIFARRAVYRELINFPLQSSAADMMKLAMLGADEIMQKDFIDDVRMMLQIHDELVFEVKDEVDVKKFSSLITDMMQNVVKLRVPLVVGFDVGSSLQEIH